MSKQPPRLEDTPVRLDEEWANAATHGVAFVASLVLACVMHLQTWNQSLGLWLACITYSASISGTFLCSLLSHTIHRQPLLNRLRAWDQAMIYLMIVGSYTPIIFRFEQPDSRGVLLGVIWIAALAGFATKVAMQHRVNSIATISYVLLGWLPAMPLLGDVPSQLGTMMLAGGVLYSVGIIFLKLGCRIRYAHAVWHLFVMAAATCHWLGILWYAVEN